MKIIFFIDGFQAGGKERRLTELIKILSLNPNIEFEVVVMQKEIHYKELLNLNLKFHFLIRNTKKDFSIFKKFFDICKNYKPDIVHCWESMPSIYAIPACKLLKIKLVNGMVIDTPVIRHFSHHYWFRAKLTFPFSDLVIGNSFAGLSAYKAPKNKSICIYNGMDFKRFESLKDPLLVKKEIFGDNVKSLFIVGMVAAFENRKDYTTLIKAAINLISSNVNIRFILIGDGVNFSRIKNSVPISLQDKIIFLGKRLDVETIVNIFDVGILLTDTKFHGEGVSNAIIEYMALGKPVIATKGGGTDEVIEDNKNGYLIDAYDDKIILKKIEFMIANPEIKQLIGKNACYTARNKFDANVMANNYVRVYQCLISGNIKLLEEIKTVL